MAPLLRSLAYAVGIGTLALCVAWPISWRIHDRSPRWLAFVMAPLIAPGYLAYVGLGLLRAPDTWLGDMLLSSSAEGTTPWPVIANRVLAVVALALWAWPIACLVLAMAIRRIDPWIWEAMRLEPTSRWRRWRMRFALTRAGVVAGVVIVALLMLGSAVPLQLAGVGTYAAELWTKLNETQADEQWRVHAASWPMVVAAIAGAALILVGLGRWTSRRTAADDAPPRRGTMWRFAPVAGVLLSVGIPTALLAYDLVTSPGSGDAMHRIVTPVRMFLRLHGDALLDSLRVAGLVLAAGVTIGLCISLLEHVARRRSWIACAGALCLVATALVPGVMIGSAVLRAFSAIVPLRPALDFWGIVSVGHVARFAYVPAIIALWMARTTPPEIVAMQRLDGADTFRGWLAITLPVQLPAILAGAFVAAALSLHEIEAAVSLAPPGSDSLARRLLEMLHFARMGELTAGTLILLALALGWGLILVLLGGLARPWANRKGGFPIT